MLLALSQLALHGGGAGVCTVLRRGSSALACLNAISIDRAAVSQSIAVLSVHLDNAQCASFMEMAGPHMLRMPGVKPVRKGEEDGRRIVLLSETLRDGALPSDLRRALDSVRGELSYVDVHLGYDDLGWQEVLRQLLPPGVVVPSSYEEVGHVIHLNLRPEQRPYRFLIGQVLLDKLRPRIRTVANKADEITTRFRSLPLELIAGDADFRVGVQHGSARLRFDYSKVYWSSRLHTEHASMAKSFKPGDLVWDMFAGVGPFAVLAAQRGVRVLANDLNPHCCEAMLDNVKHNGLCELVHVYNLDAADFVAHATASLREGAAEAGGCGGGLHSVRMRSLPAAGSGGRQGMDMVEAAATEAEASWPAHVLLNLPADSVRFLGALRGLRVPTVLADDDRTTQVPPAPLVHCYCFTRLEGADLQLQEASERVAAALGFPPVDLRVRPVRSVAPGKMMLCIEFRLWDSDVHVVDEFPTTMTTTVNHDDSR
jgi:tRNA (guanine37-N1)-methyltransferase